MAQQQQHYLSWQTEASSIWVKPFGSPTSTSMRKPQSWHLVLTQVKYTSDRSLTKTIPQARLFK